jgi:tetratricopeptide (TPR) repeat protein
MKKLFPFLLLLVIFNPLISQPNSMTSLNKVYESYLTDNRQLWQQSIQELRTAFRASAYTDGQVLYELTLAEYGLMGALYGDKPRNEDALYNMLDQAEKSAERLLKFPAYKSQAHGFLGAILAMRVGLSPMKALYLGSKSETHIKDATRLNPDNPTGWVEKGNLRFHSPAIFGGSNQEAIACFEKAVELFDQQPELRENNWLYLHAMAWLGIAYEKAGKKEKAIAIYKKAIAYENRFKWVKEELLPNLK